ncbi:MAG: hypothetical protein IJ773_06775 [Lachnospiraceae bacterium]|nr:hypothetical protein [Lachnospiraceae bacterium]
MKKLSFGRVVLLAAGVIALAGSAAYFLLDGSDRTFHMVGFLLGIAGAVSTIPALVTDLKIAPLFPAILYSVAFALVLRVAVPSLSDVLNHVNFIGGNAAMGMTYAGVYLFCALLAVIGCFAGYGKKG